MVIVKRIYKKLLFFYRQTTDILQLTLIELNLPILTPFDDVRDKKKSFLLIDLAVDKNHFEKVTHLFFFLHLIFLMVDHYLFLKTVALSYNWK